MIDFEKSRLDGVYPLRAIRDYLKLSQLELALTIGVNSMTISRAERGKTEPIFTIKQIKKLADLLDCDIRVLPEALGKDYDFNQPYINSLEDSKSKSADS